MPEPISVELAAQYAALTQTCGVVDVCDRTRIELTGQDRTGFLHGFCTNDIKRLEHGRGCEAFITNIKGKTIGHVLVFCKPDSLVLDTVPGQSDLLLRHLDRYLIREDVQMHDRTSDWGALLVAGEEASRILSQWLDADLPEAMLGHVSCFRQQTRLSVHRVPLAPGGAYLIHLPREDVAERIEDLMGAGARACGQTALETLRIEAAYPEFGRDISEANLPQEVNRDAAAISFTKGCYLGQETVARLDALGRVNRLLVAAQWSGDVVPAAGEELRFQGQPAGVVTSATWSPKRRVPLALAYVRSPHHVVGTPLESASGPAVIVGADAVR